MSNNIPDLNNRLTIPPFQLQINDRTYIITPEVLTLWIRYECKLMNSKAIPPFLLEQDISTKKYQLVAGIRPDKETAREIVKGIEAHMSSIK